jgi:hypothetical protein
MKFVISAGGMSYDFQHWVRTGGIEVRWKTDEGKFTVRPYTPPPSEPITEIEPQQPLPPQ